MSTAASLLAVKWTACYWNWLQLTPNQWISSISDWEISISKFWHFRSKLLILWSHISSSIHQVQQNCGILILFLYFRFCCVSGCMFSDWKWTILDSKLNKFDENRHFEPKIIFFQMIISFSNVEFGWKLTKIQQFREKIVIYGAILSCSIHQVQQNCGILILSLYFRFFCVSGCVFQFSWVFLFISSRQVIFNWI